MRVRRAKAAALRAAGKDPYPPGFERTAVIADLRERYQDLAPDTATGDRVAVAGRVMLYRTGGKLCFATIRDGSGDLQVMVSLDRVGADALEAWKRDVDLGDHIGVEGEVITSRRGELSVLADSFADHRQGAAAAAGEARRACPTRPPGCGSATWTCWSTRRPGRWPSCAAW